MKVDRREYSAKIACGSGKVRKSTPGPPPRHVVANASDVEARAPDGDSILLCVYPLESAKRLYLFV